MTGIASAVDVNVQQRLTKYIRQTRADIALMRSKTVQPSAVEVAEAICADLEKIAAGLSTAIGANGAGHVE